MVSRIRSAVSRQLSRPDGFGGRIIAALMNRGNDAMNDAAIEALGEVGDRDVLELGFGGGRSIEKLLSAGARVIGVDPAEEMVRRASARLADEIAAGVVEVHEGSVERLPLPDRSVDRVVTVNTVYFWTDLDSGLSEIARVLRSGGRVVVAIRDGSVMEQVDLSIFTLRPPEEIATAMESAGLAARARSSDDQAIHLIEGERPR